ncbi:MAG: flagellar protein FlaG [Actinomycetota bacterium]|nr:flagellar protein FlaG [Actinomycetota bacterium]
MNIKPVEIGQTNPKESLPADMVFKTSKAEVKKAFEAAKEQAKDPSLKGGNLDKKKSEEVLESLNEIINIFNTQLEFSVHEGTKEIMVTIMDMETKEVIREIPPKEILDMVAKMLEMVGMMVDKKA